MTTTHETIARQVAADPATLPIPARTSARQGDLILKKLGTGTPTTRLPFVAVLLAAGAHGEHWAVGPCAMNGDILTAACGTVVVHTDIPDARHRAIALEPGMWLRTRQRELGADQVIKEVED